MSAALELVHVALWTDDLERLTRWYEQHLGAQRGERYHNPTTGFSSYFLSFASGARLEVMSGPASARGGGDRRAGWAHVAFRVPGGEAAVDVIARRLRADGVALLKGPRRTGDGYYEVLVADADGNLVELTA